MNRENASSFVLPTWLLLTAVTAANAQAPLQAELELPDLNRASVTLVELGTIGSLEGKSDSFGRVMDVAIGAENSLFIADDLNHHVAVYNFSGEHLGTIGRRGNGPGEFQAPWQVAIGPADSIFVWDIERARISIFAPDLSHVREFRVPPHWVINGIEFLPNADLLIAAYESGEAGGLHVVSRTGEVIRTMGPPAGNQRLQGFEGSLLGGSVETAEDLIAYTVKSPYVLSFLEKSGRMLSVCTGDESWTTAPRDVVVESGGGYGLEWEKYVHSSRVLHVSGINFLNVIHDPVEGVSLLDVVSRDCELLSRSILREAVTFLDGRGDIVAGARSSDYPEVVIYRMKIEMH